MIKNELLHNIRAAKRAHINWVSYAHALILGVPLEKNQIPMDSSECKFGEWYYGDGQVLHGLEAFKKIEQPHIDLHDTYLEIFHLLFAKEADRSLWSRWFGKKTEVDMEKSLKKANQLYHKLKKHSVIVIDALNELEDQLNEMNTIDFSELAYI